MVDLRVKPEGEDRVYEFSLAEVAPDKWRLSLVGDDSRFAILKSPGRVSFSRVLISAIDAAISVIEKG